MTIEHSNYPLGRLKDVPTINPYKFTLALLLALLDLDLEDSPLLHITIISIILSKDLYALF